MIIKIKYNYIIILLYIKLIIIPNFFEKTNNTYT